VHIPKIDFSVLIPVYKAEKPEHLKMAIESVIYQTLPPSEIVIVKDGELTDGLDKIIDYFASNYLDLFKIVSIPKRGGLGKALQLGVLNCKYDIIARMDSDDICHAERFEKQIYFLICHPEIDLVSSFITEFDGNKENIYASREIPIDHNEIIKFAKIRNPVNHMAAVFRKKAVVNAGNYGHFPWFEDYDLWARMLLKGSRFANLPYYLVNVRAGADMVARRRGVKYAISEFKLQKRFLNMGFLNYLEFFRNITIRLFVRLLPLRIDLKIYKYVLRKLSERRNIS